MRPYFISAWRSGFRGHSFHAVFVLGILLIGCAYLAAMFSPRQPETVALDVGLSGIRFSLALLALFWVQELVGREIERRTTTLYLAYPIPRSQYILGRFLGIAALLFVTSIILALLLWVAVLLSGDMYEQTHRGALGMPYWTTVFGLWLSVVVVTSFSLLIASLSTTPALPLSLGAAFAIACQSLGAVLQYLNTSPTAHLDVMAGYTSIVIDLAGWVLPDLSRLDWRTWPMYDLPLPSGTVEFSCMMALCYIALLLTLAVRTFDKREFD